MRDIVYLFFLATLLGLIVGYSGNLQTATKWIGKRLFLDPRLYLRGTIKGNMIQWQTFVTPPTQTALNLSQIALTCGIIAFFWLVKWYIVVLALIFALGVSTASKALFPKRLDWHVDQILVFMTRREQVAAKGKNEELINLLRECRSVVAELAKEANRTGILILDKSLD